MKLESILLSMTLALCAAAAAAGNDHTNDHANSNASKTANSNVNNNVNNNANNNDNRQLVELPSHMRQHMLGNMRDHLRALSEIQSALAGGEFDKAADIAEQRLGMSSLAAHGASHLAQFMPEKMQTIGTEMHRSASRFAVVAQQSAVAGDVKPALEGLANLTQQCVACHAAFRVH